MKGRTFFARLNGRKFLLLTVMAALIHLGAVQKFKEEPFGGKLKISSPAFEEKRLIPAKYTCEAENVNPSLRIEGLPLETKALALIVDDPDVPVRPFVHWVVFNIPATSEIGEKTIPGKQGKSDFGILNYGGPCPPTGTHRYFFKIYALDQELSLQEGVRKPELEKAMEGHVLEKGALIGLYKKTGVKKKA